MSKLMVAATTLCVLTACSQAQAQDIDPAFRADVEKLLETTNAAATGAQMAATLSAQLIDAMRRQQPQAPPRAAEIIKEVVASELPKASDDAAIRDVLVRIYARHFTRADVTGLLNFYTSELGRKVIVAMPLISQEGAAAAQQWAAANMTRIVGVLQQRLREEKLIP